MSKSIISSGISNFERVVPLLPLYPPGLRADFALDTFFLFGSEEGGILELLLFKPFWLINNVTRSNNISSAALSDAVSDLSVSSKACTL
jgi:hypothetical protein